MKAKLALLLTLTLLPSARAEDARFFRMVGPVATTITALSADGYASWTNAPTNATFTVQTTSSLLSAINWVDYIQVPATNPVTTHRLYDPNPPSGMAFIPAGSFTMGDTLDADTNALPLHTVYVSAIFMDKYEVTKALWDDVYNWAITNGYSFFVEAQGKANNHPAQNVTWFDAVKWCNARSEKEGRTPAYYTSAAQTTVYRSGQENSQDDWVKWSAGFRLPTEAEWEKAARGGAGGRRFPWTDTEIISQSRANYYGYPASSGGYNYDLAPPGYSPMFNDGGVPFTSPVGYFAPNGYGLYDMAGNVSEWCWDWHGSYSSATKIDPRGATSGSGRVLRGGGWNNHAFYSRTAARIDLTPDAYYFSRGFRSILPAVQ